MAAELSVERLREIVQVIPVVRVSVSGLDTAEEAPSIQSYRVDAHAKGMFARVCTEFTLFNPNHRVLEGDLEFPLPDEGVVCGYAIDVNGVMVEGRVVEKEKARIAFENEVKKGVDPGLVEHVKGNIYRTRIYPIPAQGTRCIRVEYITPLTVSMNGDGALFIPMPDHKLKQRDVEITVEMPESHRPILGGLGDKRFEMAQSVWRVESHETDVVSSDHLLIGMPQLPNTIVSTEEHEGHRYFCTSILLPPVEKSVEDIKKWRILWDASGSRGQNDIDKALKTIQVLPDDGEYELHVFRNVCAPVKVFHSRKELYECLQSVHYDGGTNFDSLKEIASCHFDGMTLLFSDGLDTYSGSNLSFSTRAVALVSGIHRDLLALKRMCGGRAIDIGLVSEKELLNQIISSAPVVSGVDGEGICDVEGIGQPAEGRVTVLGRVQNQCVHGELKLSNGKVYPFDIDTSSHAGQTLSTAWAARRIDELSASPDDNREELLSLGRYFSIVSPVSSMIVFERLEQWLEYNIEPPESLKEIHDEWVKRHPSESKLESERISSEHAWIDDLRREWKSRVEWYNNPVPQKRFISSGVFEEQPAMLGAAVDRRPPAMSAPRALLNRAIDTLHEISDAVMNRGTACRREAPRMAARCRDAVRSEAPIMCDEEVCCEPCEEPTRSLEVSDECVEEPSHHNEQSSGATVTIKAWDPETPYLTALKDVEKIFKDDQSLYAEYIKQREKYRTSPAFYLDCAGFFFKHNMNEIAIRVLSNLSELKLEDTALLRVYAWRLREAGELDASIEILRKIIKLRTDEAVSWRDLALTLTMRAKQKKSAEDVTDALKHFHKAAFTPWKRRDAKWTSLVSLEEFNALVEWSKHQDWKDNAPVIPHIDEEFQKNIDTDLRIVLMWDADDTDIDLHVLEPSGEEVFYRNQRSQSGGLLSFDVTTGYGPEEYLHKCAPKGTYKVMTNYYASHQQSLTGPVTVTVTVFTNWGRENETSQILSLRLEKAKDKVSVGSIEV